MTDSKLMIVDSSKYNQTIVKIVKSLKKKSVCYVTLNKTFNSLKEIFKKNKINNENLLFVDAISKSLENVGKETENCYFINSPGALTEISLVISKFVKHDFECVIFDSINSLLIYRDQKVVRKFVTSIVSKINESKTNIIFIVLKSKELESLINEISTIFDKVEKVK